MATPKPEATPSGRSKPLRPPLSPPAGLFPLRPFGCCGRKVQDARPGEPAGRHSFRHGQQRLDMSPGNPHGYRVRQQVRAPKRATIRALLLSFTDVTRWRVIFEQVREGHAETCRDLDYDVEGRVSQAGLDSGEVGTVEVGTLRQVLLGEPLRRTEATDAVAERSPMGRRLERGTWALGHSADDDANH